LQYLRIVPKARPKINRWIQGSRLTTEKTIGKIGGGMMPKSIAGWLTALVVWFLIPFIIFWETVGAITNERD
jgi:hypothetical protein